MPPEDPVRQAEVRAVYGTPDPRVVAKQLTRLDRHAAAFIRLSPFLVMASADARGQCDATPRGDAPGFVAILDETRLLIPDRIGNRRVDTMMNVCENPNVGLLFLVPGIDESLRVNGRAAMTRDAALLEPLTVQGRAPVAGLLVTVEEVFFHCGKALMRSDLWNAERQVARSSFPTLGKILADQLAEGRGQAEAERWIADSYAKRLY